MLWTEGDWVVRREVLSNGPWLGVIAKIIEDSPEHLISYIPEKSPFGFPAGNWPTSSGEHQWADRQCWHGHGCLMIQKPQDASPHHYCTITNSTRRFFALPASVSLDSTGADSPFP